MIYANENDPKAAHWLTRVPVRIDHVDSRSITEVSSDDLLGFTQCHFFAGIGGWPYALQLAGWPTDAPVWTGSCPCQPFSQAGKGKGTADERHLWPEFLRLIAQCRPATVFGEQVASKAGRSWLATVRTDLEALGYAVGAADLSAAGVGAPHIRQRLFWVADSRCEHGDTRRHDEDRTEAEWSLTTGVTERRSDGGLADADGRDSSTERQQRGREQRLLQEGCGSSRLGNTNSEQQGPLRSVPEGTGAIASRSPWSNTEYIPCRDGKARPVKPGVRLLAHGIPGRVPQLRGLGNAIVPQIAAEFVKAFLDTR